MGLILYTISTRLYFFAITISSFFFEKAHLFKSGRKNIFSKLKKDISNNFGNYIWFHCASLGEFEQGRPVIEAFKRNFPEYKILLTFFSPSGFEIQKNYEHADLVYYLPEDTPKNARMFLDIVKPKLIIFIKYEFWYFFISEIHHRNIPILSISSIFRREQLFFKFYGKFYREILRNFSHFFVQDENSYFLLQNIGIKNITVSGDTRFDRVHEITKKITTIPEIDAFRENNKVFVAGSIWKEDLYIIKPIIKEFPNIKFIIVPHEIKVSFIKEIVLALPDNSRYSTKIENERQVLIVDKIGILSTLYKYADYAFIGGAYGKGLHNILEAAAFGTPIFFGNKNYKKFGEAINLIKKGGAFPIAHSEELKRIIVNFEQKPIRKKAVDTINKDFVAENIGATEKIVEYSNNILKGKNERKGI